MDVITPGVLDVDILMNRYRSNALKTKNYFLTQVFEDEKNKKFTKISYTK